MAEQSAEPAAKKQKLEEAERVPVMISPAELDRIIDFVVLRSETIDAATVKQIKSDAKAAFLPDVSKYIGKIYVSLHIELAGGEANAHFTTTHEDWDLIQDATHDDAFRRGHCCRRRPCDVRVVSIFVFAEVLHNVVECILVLAVASVRL